jgi:hypothetical protein
MLISSDQTKMSPTAYFLAAGYFFVAAWSATPTEGQARQFQDEHEAMQASTTVEDVSQGAAIVEALTRDLASLPAQQRHQFLYDLGAASLKADTLSTFRQIVSAAHDPNWSTLSDLQTALSLLDWLPDTAAYIEARIAAAGLISASSNYEAAAQVRLWKSIRARTERVAQHALTKALVEALLVSRQGELALETYRRASLDDADKLEVILLMGKYRDVLDRESLRLLSEDVEALGAVANIDARTKEGVLFGLCDLGHPERAFSIARAMAQPADRMKYTGKLAANRACLAPRDHSSASGS